ncbi:hypothetical protein LTR56_003351 [Elasticomyces elasticus]|nr:hypothetical protein LTR56_003351 [Elasticomyces elasticus]KAK3664231.1 hypothetical protein LTR22_004929 [Elasticomyces elasticus]KAK4931446.1 hypothetical protein LTR49_002147 [Elasticomyces elasticus]KAK5766034.1 hypothetical protein LTS12_003780 [Elasticomyces elasticus]
MAPINTTASARATSGSTGSTTSASDAMYNKEYVLSHLDEDFHHLGNGRWKRGPRPPVVRPTVRPVSPVATAPAVQTSMEPPPSVKAIDFASAANETGRKRKVSVSGDDHKQSSPVKKPKVAGTPKVAEKPKVQVKTKAVKQPEPVPKVSPDEKMLVSDDDQEFQSTNSSIDQQPASPAPVKPAQEIIFEDNPTFDKAHVLAHSGQDFHHLGNGVWKAGKGPPRTGTRQNVATPDKEVGKLPSPSNTAVSPEDVGEHSSTSETEEEAMSRKRNKSQKVLDNEKADAPASVSQSPRKSKSGPSNRTSNAPAPSSTGAGEFAPIFPGLAGLRGGAASRQPSDEPSTATNVNAATSGQDPVGEEETTGEETDRNANVEHEEQAAGDVDVDAEHEEDIDYGEEAVEAQQVRAAVLSQVDQPDNNVYTEKWVRDHPLEIFYRYSQNPLRFKRGYFPTAPQAPLTAAGGAEVQYGQAAAPTQQAPTALQQSIDYGDAEYNAHYVARYPNDRFYSIGGDPELWRRGVRPSGRAPQQQTPPPRRLTAAEQDVEDVDRAASILLQMFEAVEDVEEAPER